MVIQRAINIGRNIAKSRSTRFGFREVDTSRFRCSAQLQLGRIYRRTRSTKVAPVLDKTWHLQVADVLIRHLDLIEGLRVIEFVDRS